jgi:predicted small lipoprotein YifL
MSRSFVYLLQMFGLIVFLGCAGCGFKGPLYLPEGTTTAQKAAPPPLLEPAPDRPLPAQSAPAPK